MNTELIIIAVVTLIVIILFSTTRTVQVENFQEIIKADIEQVSFPGKTFYLDDSNQVLSSGTIAKYTVGDMFNYEYLFNLPVLGSAFHQTTVGGEFNAPREIGEYKVFAGDVKDGKNLRHIGKLERHGDGWHKLYFQSKEDYVKTCVVIDDEVIHCAEL